MLRILQYNLKLKTMITERTVYRVKSNYYVYLIIEKEGTEEYAMLSRSRKKAEDCEVMKITKRTKKGLYLWSSLFGEKYITHTQLEKLE